MEVGNGGTQQDHNAAVGSVNMVEIQFGSVGICQTHPAPLKSQ